MTQPRRFRDASCYGKERMSATRAQTVAAQMRRRHHDGLISAYRCEFCSGWHVGSHIARTLKPRKDGTDG